MAVTLTSTGITFSDGTGMTTAPSAGGLNYQEFNSSGTWNHSSAGSPGKVLVYGRGGSGGKFHYSHNYGSGNAAGGGGGAFIAEPRSVSGNESVTVGSGASTGITFCGFYNYSCQRAQSGNTTTAVGVSANGGSGGQYAGTDGANPSTGGSGSGNGIASLSAPTWNGGSNSFGGQAGLTGKAFIVW
jgi:hypothetical protein